MFRIWPAAACFVVVASTLSHGQDTLSVDVAAPMPVCRANQQDSSQACATPPRLIHKIDPSYPEEDRKAKVEGAVVMNVVIGNDGKVGAASVAKSLKSDMDAAAMAAVRQWEFQPG